MENKLIAIAAKDREAFEELLLTDIKQDLSDKAKILWDEIAEFYGKDPESVVVDIDVIKSRIKRKYPKHAELLNSYLDNLEEISVPNILQEVIDLKLENVRTKLAQELISGNDKKVESLLEEYEILKRGELGAEEAKAEVFYNTSVESILENTSGGNRISILPRTLNQQINGGVLRQHHVVVFAPTDMGKSLFTLNMTYGFLKQGLKVLYCGNEDPAMDMIFRLMWRITKMSREEIIKEPHKADALLQERGYKNLVFVELTPGTPKEIESLIEEHKPDVLIVDQIRNLDMGEANKVLQLERAAIMMRNFGKKYNIVPVSLTQAADSATGKALLNRGDIDFSNVGIPGTADLLLGIGATEEMENKGERMISFVKNKVSGIKSPIKVWFDPMATKVH